MNAAEISQFGRAEGESEGNSGNMEENPAWIDRIGANKATMNHPILKQRKIYVGVGKDNVETLSALHWALNNWVLLNGDSIVLLHVYTPATFITTPLGKFRQSEVGQDSLHAFRKDEKAKMDLLLKKYVMMCSNFKVMAEALTVEKEEAHKAIVGLISELHMRKLVIGTTSSSSISRRMKLTGDQADYVQKHAPDFCKLHIICKGKLVYLNRLTDPTNLGAFNPSMNSTGIGGFEEWRLDSDKGTSVVRVEGLRRKFRKEQRGLKISVSVSKQPESYIDKTLPASQFRRSNLPTVANFMPQKSRGLEQDVNVSLYRDSEDISEDIEKYFDFLVEKNPDYGIMWESESAEHNEAVEAMEILCPDPRECLDQNMEIAMDSETLKMRINQILKVAKIATNSGLSEAEKCKKSEWATHISLEKANYYENLYHKEIRQKEETRELLMTFRQQMLEISRERDEVIEELEITGQSLRILGNLVNEVSTKRDNAIQDLQNVSENLIKLKLQIFLNRKQRDSVLRELQTHHNRDESQLNECIYRECSCDDKDSIIRAIHLEEDEEEYCHEASEVPSFFMCPILQDVMQDPHIAADGFTYELESIKGWIDSGHDTSPMTNLKLGHKFLTPNFSLLSAIRHWQQRRPLFSKLGNK